MEDGGGFAGGHMDGLQTMGILNALKTGNVALDMVIAMTIPLVIKILFDSAGNMEDIFKAIAIFFFGERKDPENHHRNITHKCGDDLATDYDLESKNAILIKAIQLYIHSELNLELRDADVELLETFEKHKALKSNTTVGYLSNYNIVRKPPCDEWISLGKFGDDKDRAVVQVRINVEESEQQDNSNGRKSSSSNTIKRDFSFKSHSGEAIDSFLDTAYSWYIDEMRKQQDTTRYLYELKTTGQSFFGRDDDNEQCKYKRYALSDEKTFDSLFFPEKESILNILNNFLERKGKYAIKGYPHKLGLLLYGPPGTGKTSLIKALANATGRSIVNVPLARIHTNAELQTIMFDRKYDIEGEYMSLTMEYNDVIFVMEDVDAACDFVKRRDGKLGRVTSFGGKAIEIPIRRSMWQMLLASRESSCKELVQKLMEKSEELKEEAAQSGLLVSTATRLMALPGLTLVGEAGNDAKMRKVGEQAVEHAGKLMESYSSIDSFLSLHAETLLTLLEAGAEVDDNFVRALLDDSPNIGADGSTWLETNESAIEKNKDPVVETAAAMAGIAEMMGGRKDKEGPTLGMAGKSKLLDDDKLSLSGLLNVLDGVVDCPGRVIIMTTNHPEQLDPALIRPGRIDKKILLGYMQPTSIIQMMEHYFQGTLSQEQMDRVSSAVKEGGLQLTPAVVEQMTAENEFIEDMIQALEKKVHFNIPLPARIGA